MESGSGPAVGMIVVQVFFAGLTIVSKLAMDSGMSPYVMIAYRQLVATVALAPVSFFLERKSYNKITGRVLLQLFVSALFGATGNQLLYCLGLKHSTPTITCALTNTLPAITFLIAVPFRMETLSIKTLAGHAKIIGTIICVGGSIFMTVYQGPRINVPSSPIHWKYIEDMTASEGPAGGQNSILGAVLLILSSVTWALWFIIQAKMGESFSSPYTSSTLMFAMASLQCGAIGATVDRDVSTWEIGWDIKLVATLYSGVFCSALAVLIMSWTIAKKGPLYASMFRPLVLIIVAVLGWAIMDENLTVGSLVGSLLICGGLYMVLWGSARETQRVADFGGMHPDEELGLDGKILISMNLTPSYELQDDKLEAETTV